MTLESSLTDLLNLKAELERLAEPSRSNLITVNQVEQAATHLNWYVSKAIRIIGDKINKENYLADNYFLLPRKEKVWKETRSAFHHIKGLASRLLIEVNKSIKEFEKKIFESLIDRLKLLIDEIQAGIETDVIQGYFEYCKQYEDILTDTQDKIESFPISKFSVNCLKYSDQKLDKMKIDGTYNAELKSNLKPSKL